MTLVIICSTELFTSTTFHPSRELVLTDSPYAFKTAYSSLG